MPIFFASFLIKTSQFSRTIYWKFWREMMSQNDTTVQTWKLTFWKRKFLLIDVVNCQMRLNFPFPKSEFKKFNGKKITIKFFLKFGKGKILPHDIFEFIFDGFPYQILKVSFSEIQFLKLYFFLAYHFLTLFSPNVKNDLS